MNASSWAFSHTQTEHIFPSTIFICWFESLVILHLYRCGVVAAVAFSFHIQWNVRVKMYFYLFSLETSCSFPKNNNNNNNTRAEKESAQYTNEEIKYVHALAHVFQWQLFCFITMTCVQAAFFFSSKAHAVQHVLCVSLLVAYLFIRSIALFWCRCGSWVILVLLLKLTIISNVLDTWVRQFFPLRYMKRKLSWNLETKTI